MKRSLFLLIFCLSLLASPVFAQEDPASEIVLLVNQLRASYGLPPYQVDPILTAVAQAQVEWMAANDNTGHLGPGGTTPDQRAKLAGYGADGIDAFVVENVAMGTLGLNTPDMVVTMWQGDEGHLAAMISPEYEDMGVGYTEAFGMSWFVMMVGWTDEGVAEDEAEEEPKKEKETVEATAISAVLNPPFSISTPDETGAIYHEVLPGQAAWTIAVYYEIELAELMALNNLTEDSYIHPGDLLLIRPGTTATPALSATPQAVSARIVTGTPAAPTLPPMPTTTLPARVTSTPIPQEPAEARTLPTRLVMLLGISGGMVLLTILIIRLNPDKP